MTPPFLLRGDPTAHFRSASQPAVPTLPANRPTRSPHAAPTPTRLTPSRRTTRSACLACGARGSGALSSARRMMNADEIAAENFSGKVSPAWVRKTVAPQHKKTFGRSTVLWYEDDVISWMNTRGSAR